MAELEAPPPWERTRLEAASPMFLTILRALRAPCVSALKSHHSHGIPFFAHFAVNPPRRICRALMVYGKKGIWYNVTRKEN